MTYFGIMLFLLTTIVRGWHKRRQIVYVTFFPSPPYNLFLTTWYVRGTI